MENSTQQGNDGVGLGLPLGDLPENCISIILSFTTAKDVCRFAAVCTAWRSAAISDMVWERMITLHYGGQNIWEAVSLLAFSSKKQLYFCLVTDHATKSIWVDGSSGKIGCMISARDLSMTPLGHDEDGWMEFVAGEFFLQEQPGSAEIEFSMKNIDCSFTKSGIWLDGVKIQPKH